MVGEEQPTQYEEHYICARPCGCYGKHMVAVVVKHLVADFDGIMALVCVHRQMQVTN